MLETVTP